MATCELVIEPGPSSRPTLYPLGYPTAPVHIHCGIGAPVVSNAAPLYQHPQAMVRILDPSSVSTIHHTRSSER